MTIRAPLHTRIAPRQRPAELLTWFNDLPPGEITKTMPPRQSSWPNPVLRTDSRELRSWFAGLIADTTGTPLIPVDWPNPIRRLRNQSLYSVTYSQQIPQPVAAAMPFTQDDWPNPIRRAPNPSLYVVSYSQQLQPVTAQPFVQSDWPNPPARRQNPELRTWVDQPPWQLTVGQPFSQDDWPNPVLRTDSRELRTWVESLNIANIGAPFAQTDWPNPVRRTDSIGLRSWVNGIQIEPTPQAPGFSGPIPDIFQRKDTGTYTYDLSVYFVGALTYAISPAVETGWTFDVNTAVLVIDTDELGVFGPFTVTATNLVGDTPSNAFSVEVAVPPPAVGTQLTGGFFALFERQHAHRRKRLLELEEAEEAARQLKDSVDREIAQLLQEQERKAEFDANIVRLKRLVGEFADKEAEAAMSERVRTALARAQAQESVSAYLSLQRELERFLEDEEFAILMMLASQ